jgi:beta-phosphoglucomutase-like phosphatase (HAD superfamily)
VPTPPFFAQCTNRRLLSASPKGGYNAGMHVILNDAEAVLFDLDGTLVETDIDFSRLRAASLQLIAEYGIDTAPLQEMDALGAVEQAVNTLREAGKKQESAELRQRAFARLQAMEMAYCASPRPVPGMYDLLHALRSRGARIGIITRNDREVSLRTLNALQIPYDLLVSRDDVRQVKPHPEHVRVALQQWDIAPARCVVVGRLLDGRGGGQGSRLSHGGHLEAGCAHQPLPPPSTRPAGARAEGAAMTLSVLIVNWNTRDLLRACLQSLRQYPLSEPMEVWVLDNASRDGSAEMVQQEFPEVHLIASDCNLGYAAGNNRLIQQARGRVPAAAQPRHGSDGRGIGYRRAVHAGTSRSGRAGRQAHPPRRARAAVGALVSGTAGGAVGVFGIGEAVPPLAPLRCLPHDMVHL